MPYYNEHNKRYITIGNNVRRSIPCEEYPEHDGTDCRGRKRVASIDKTFVSGDGYMWVCDKCGQIENCIL